MSKADLPEVAEAKRLANAHNLIIAPKYTGAGQVRQYNVLRKMPTCNVFVGKAVSPGELLTLVKRLSRTEQPRQRQPIEKEAAL